MSYVDGFVAAVPTANKDAYRQHAAAAAEGKGVVVVDGKLVENLHVENAERLVALARAIAELDAAA